MYEAGVVVQFEAAHRLAGDFGPAGRLHGHTYRVEVTVRGPEPREDGTLLDLGVLQRAVGAAVADLDYRNLDEVEGLRGGNTTAEAVARYLFEHIAPSIRSRGLSSLGVRVWESPLAFGGFEAPIG